MPVLLCMLMAIPMTTTQGAKSWPCVCLQVSLLVVHPPCTQPFNIERSCLSIQLHILTTSKANITPTLKNVCILSRVLGIGHFESVAKTKEAYVPPPPRWSEIPAPSPPQSLEVLPPPPPPPFS